MPGGSEDIEFAFNAGGLSWILGQEDPLAQEWQNPDNNPNGQRSLAGHRTWGLEGSDTNEQLFSNRN